MDGSAFFISIVVPAYNEEQTVEEAVRELLAVPMPFHAEFIVVDDGSSDDTLIRLRRIRDPRLRIVRHPRNRGKGAALQTGAELAKGNPHPPVRRRPRVRPQRHPAPGRPGARGALRRGLRLPDARNEHGLPVVPLRPGQPRAHPLRERPLRLRDQRPPHVPEAGPAAAVPLVDSARTASAWTPSSPRGSWGGIRPSTSRSPARAITTRERRSAGGTRSMPRILGTSGRERAGRGRERQPRTWIAEPEPAPEPASGGSLRQPRPRLASGRRLGSRPRGRPLLTVKSAWTESARRTGTP